MSWALISGTEKNRISMKKFQSEEEPLLASEDGQDIRESISSGSKRKKLPRNDNKFQFAGNASPGMGGFGASIQSSQAQQASKPKVQKQPNRTTKVSQKLVVFPESFISDARVTDLASDYGDGLDEKLVEYPYDIAKEKEAERLKKVDKKGLPRVTAFCTAKAYSMDALYAFLLSKTDSNMTDPKRIDECIYTPYTPPVTIFQFPPPSATKAGHQRMPSVPQQVQPRSDTSLSSRSDRSSPVPMSSKQHVQRVDPSQPGFSTPPSHSGWARAVEDDGPGKEAESVYASKQLSVRTHPTVGELFFFDYGVVVIWGLTEPQEQYILSILKPFQEEKLDVDDIESEAFHFQYRALSQPRIFNDVIILRTPVPTSNAPPVDDDYEHHNITHKVSSQDSMIKLAISHAIAQSTKLTLYEGRIDDTITNTQNIPLIMAKTGKVPMSRSSIIKKIGQLFVMRINVNLVSPILDTPEIFWSEPSLDPLYAAVRGYLEISQRVELLNQRCGVISDLLDMLKEHLNSAHGETLEWIIIVLIGIEILIGLVTIFFDFFNFYKP